MCTELGTALVARNLDCECSATALFSLCQRKSQRVRRAWTLPQWLGVREPGSGTHRLMCLPRWGRHPWKLGGSPFELDPVREVGVGPASWHLYESTTKNSRQGAGGVRPPRSCRGTPSGWGCPGIVPFIVLLVRRTSKRWVHRGCCESVACVSDRLWTARAAGVATERERMSPSFSGKKDEFILFGTEMARSKRRAKADIRSALCWSPAREEDRETKSKTKTESERDVGIGSEVRGQSPRVPGGRCRRRLSKRVGWRRPLAGCPIP